MPCVTNFTFEFNLFHEDVICLDATNILRCPYIYALGSNKSALQSVHSLKSTTLRGEPRMVSSSMPPSREDPVIKKLDSPEFRSIFTPELKILVDLFERHNYTIRIAGGAVRDILSGLRPKDLDFATDATPSEMKEIFQENEIRMINTNGEKHGTITARINDKDNFEVTTLRIDVVTDGRRAEVQFTKDWKLDALRRDLTINSMFLDFEGKIYDYFFGYDDLLKKRVVFVGSPENRIKEDYLRILRYFRFYGRVAEFPDRHEEGTINAIKENALGLRNISGERIWLEWQKILSGNFARELTLKMLHCGLAKYIGLPEKPDTEHFDTVCQRSLDAGITLKPVSFVAALLRNETEVMDMHARLKLSSGDRNLAFFLVQHRDAIVDKEPLKHYLRIMFRKRGTKDIKQQICELLRYRGEKEFAEEFEKFEPPVFPVNGTILKPYGKPKQIGNILLELKDLWLERNFNMTQEELLNEVPRIVAELYPK